MVATAIPDVDSSKALTGEPLALTLPRMAGASPARESENIIREDTYS